MIKSIELHDLKDINIFWDLYSHDGATKLVVIHQLYESPFGKIYDETHEDVFKTRNLRISQFDVESLLC